ncbi:hypothetical protein T11_11510 [Trichinella zimbabwensis]|uniref:Uncharacterized protein n=2 Tax=Trichinella TaxID=6333 RepID=A0A0V1LWI8_9BILA|nr:hypothetical protein T11_11510 [Trichinella zimbabwensis]KRZ63859.1 hypothetical protein T10_10474 [Trichinella papuae]
MPTLEAIYSTTTGLFPLTKFRNFREKFFSPKITGIDLYRSGIMTELQKTYPHRS